MKEQSDLCFTFDAACDAAINMEKRVFESFLHSIRIVKDEAAAAILRDAASARLEIRHKLEMAAIMGKFDENIADGPVPTMNLNIRCCDHHKLGPDADNRKALAFAIQMAKESIDFYRTMTKHCQDAPMAELFGAIGDDQTRHLQELEDTYEKHFLTEG